MVNRVTSSCSFIRLIRRTDQLTLIYNCSSLFRCVVQRFRNGTFVERQGTTIGVDFTMKTVTVDGGSGILDFPYVAVVFDFYLFLLPYYLFTLMISY